jgi:hypothetical protein
VVSLGCSGPSGTPDFSSNPSFSATIQSWHSRRRVPISRSRSEFARGLCTGAVITLAPRCVSKAFNSAEKILSWS